jgi:hypothetical protein
MCGRTELGDDAAGLRMVMLEIEVAAVDTGPVAGLPAVADVDTQRAWHVGFVAVVSRGGPEVPVGHPLLRRLAIPRPIGGTDVRVGAATHAVDW